MVDDKEGQPTVLGVGPEPDPGIARTLAPSDPDPSKPARTRRETSIPTLDAHLRYTLGETIGRGGQGEVVLARDQQIGREVAVKRIRAAEPSAETLARFVREARVQGRLEHPAVVPVHDLAVDRDGRPFFVMKRLSGTPMSELIVAMREGREDAVATRRRMLRAFADVCLAVELAHTQGIIHRDLKPANVMLGDFGEVYVLDWGVARAVADPDEPAIASAGDGLALDTGETRAGTILGTPAYMAPEQLAGEPAGPAADVYALGCVLFEIVAGEGLFKGPRSIASQPNPRPSSRRPDAPPELDAICERALALDPAARYPSARALHVAVQAFLDGDRDVAVRKELALGHVDEARAALANTRDELGRRKAIRAAGRALALDPDADRRRRHHHHADARAPADDPRRGRGAHEPRRHRERARGGGSPRSRSSVTSSVLAAARVDRHRRHALRRRVHDRRDDLLRERVPAVAPPRPPGRPDLLWNAACSTPC